MVNSIRDIPGEQRVVSEVYREILDELWDLHRLKAASYGNLGDTFHNFTVVEETFGQSPLTYPVSRDLEKSVRVINLIKQGKENEIEEFLDKAAINIICEIIRRKHA